MLLQKRKLRFEESGMMKNVQAWPLGVLSVQE